MTCSVRPKFDVQTVEITLLRINLLTILFRPTENDVFSVHTHFLFTIKKVILFYYMLVLYTDFLDFIISHV